MEEEARGWAWPGSCSALDPSSLLPITCGGLQESSLDPWSFWAVWTPAVERVGAGRGGDI